MLEIMKTKTQTLIAIIILALFTSCNKESQNNSINQGTGAGGSTARFTIAGNYLYTVDRSSLKSFLISDPNNPVFKSKTDIGINIETIFPYQDKLFIGSSSTMYIFSLADPATPHQIGSATYQVRMSCDPVVVKDSVTYATLRADGPCGWGISSLVVYDVSNLSSPVLRNTIPLTSPHGLGISGNALYVCNGENGLTVFDVSNPFAPNQVSEIHDKIFYDVIPYDNVLICQVSDGFALYDIGTNPLNPVFISNVLN
jgi:hypothetical protein